MATFLRCVLCCLLGLMWASVAPADPLDDERPAVLPGSSLERLHRPFQRNLDRLDPSQDRWQTEAFHERTVSQLKKLASAIEEPGADGSLRSLVADDFSSTSLRPSDLRTVFQDEIFVVRRGTTGASSSTYVGAVGLARAIDDLTRGISSTGRHVHFKTVRVALEPSVALTTMVFQLGGTKSRGGIQQIATWACRWSLHDGTQHPRLMSVRVTDFEEASARGPMFQDRTVSALGESRSFQQQLSYGIDDWADRLDRRLGIDLVATHGVALGDVDGDGLDDLYLCEPGGLPNRLYLHKPDGTLRDVSAVTGVDYLESTRSALFVDLDNDGDQDLVMAADRFVVFLANDGWGRFRRAAGFRTSATTASLAAADYDRDSDLDVYVCAYSTIESDAMIGLGNPVPFHDANNGARNTLYRNDGNWSFTDATKAANLDQDNMRFSLAAAWQDHDRDGDPDLYVANDYGRNCLYRNDDGRFTNVARSAGVEDVSAGMSVSWGDFNRDGWPDLYISNMFSSAGNRIAYQRQFQRAANATTRGDYRRFARGNSLFQNAGDGTFRDVTLESHTTMGRWAWGSNFVDLNNDGWEDLVVANGMVTHAGDSGDL